MTGKLDEQLVYRKRLRRPLSEYQRNVPPHVRAARLADEQNIKLGRPAQYQNAARSNTCGRLTALSRWITGIHRWITSTI
ncbi:DNA polymerase II [Citrobacter koseri]|uniref:DNA-directed DNA polymerase n=1 Tax=Citrobacter koseri TaxID=545 RepID=A0A3S4IGR4_CITKO|nr:DNA polymerase II [Citrobacter koseri]